MLFLAKSYFCLFLQEIKSEKNTTRVFMEKEGHREEDGHEGVPEAQKGGPHVARFLGRVGPPIWCLERPLGLIFGVPLHIYKKPDDLEGEVYSRNRAPPPPRSSFSETD